MSTDDLSAQISAVEQEIVRSSTLSTRQHKRNIPWLMIIGSLLLFIIVDEFIESSAGSGLETDLNHMMQQARYEVLEYRQEHGGILPSGIHNPSLKPYISIVALDSSRFLLKGKLGIVEQELVEQ